MADIGPDFVTRFETFANSFHFGFLKRWKANCLIWTLSRVPAIVQDEDRLLKYLMGSLQMEGFQEDDTIQIRDWIFTNFCVSESG